MPVCSHVSEGIEGLDMNDTDTMGDGSRVYTGQDGGKRHQRPIPHAAPYHPHDGADDETTLDDVICDPAMGSGRIRDGVGTLYQGA